MLLDRYSEFGGVYSETTAVHHVLAHLGVVAPHTKEPFSEALLFGISGGIGLSYFTFEYEGYAPTLYIGVAHRYKTRYGQYMDGLYARLGLVTEVNATVSENVAQKHLNSALDQGKPAILYVDRGQLPYYATPDVGGDHAIVAYGYSAEGIHIAERAAVPLTLTPQVLSSARRAIGSLKNRSVTLEAPGSEIDLKQAITAGMRACYHQYVSPPSPTNNFGINALSKWASLVNDPRDRKGWPHRFPPGPKLYAALFWTFVWTQIAQSGDGALRSLYADFVTEASKVLGNPVLAEVAPHYGHASKMWNQLADAALPDSIALLRETKELLRHRDRLFVAKGADALPEMEAVNERLTAIRVEVAEAFPLDAAQSRELLDDVHERVLQVHRAEKTAIESLGDAVAIPQM